MIGRDNAQTDKKLAFKTTQKIRHTVIYVFSIKDDTHKGLLKIGMTTEPDELVQLNKNDYIKYRNNSSYLRSIAKQRIDHIIGTAGDVANLKYASSGYSAYTKSYFTDGAVHDVLNRSGYHPVKLNGKAKEWYRLKLIDAERAIDAVKEGHSYIPKPSIKSNPVHFRPEQKSVINKTVKLFESNSKDNNKMLWNIKMRFGKTLCALQVAKSLKSHHILIVTHRPDVDDSWHDDFTNKLFKTKRLQSKYAYSSDNYGAKTIRELNKSGKKYFRFTSLQDLDGSKYSGNGQLDKDKAIFDNYWDLLIIDEAHEGTQTQETQNLLKNLDYDKMLSLSGTPFNLLASGKYKADQICTWNYTDEQSRKNYLLNQNNSINPYACMPKMTIYTFNMGRRYQNYINPNSQYFNFTEFFKVNHKTQDFVHKKDIADFLLRIGTPSITTNYPYSQGKYRDQLRHTLWVLPSISSARALKPMIERSPGLNNYHVVNAVEDDDNSNKSDNALNKVKSAIHKYDYTITLTVRKLTLGVTVPEWSAVMFLSDIKSTSLYLQAAFRCQSPWISKNKQHRKTNCYVFDFSPRRALEMYANVAHLNPSHSSTGVSEKDNETLELKNQCRFMPIISIKGNSMAVNDVDRVIRELNKSFADKTVQNGFDCNDLYNDDALMHLNGDDFSLLDKIHKHEKDSKRHGKPIILNPNDILTAKHNNKKPESKRTSREKHAIDKVECAQLNRKWAINVLRPISLRIPLLIYGMRTEFNAKTKASDFTKEVDNLSWDDFMPKGVTKERFNECLKFYDVNVFISAGEVIQDKVKAIDREEPLKRATDIADIVGHFQNPDNQSVLTPWQTINQHVGSIFGGLSNFDDTFNIKETPHLLTGTNKKVFNPKSHILEMSSRTGLYSLYLVSTLYYQVLTQSGANLTTEQKWSLWYRLLNNNIYIIANSPMARDIIIRTLIGFNSSKPKNIRYEDEFVDKVNNPHQTFIEQAKKDPNKTIFEIEKGIRGFKIMKFDVVIGNPPYAKNDNKKNSASPIYQYFVDLSERLSKRFVSLIIPTKWYVAGKGLGKFRKHMLNDPHMRELLDFMTPESVFPNTHIRGGVTIFLWDKKYDNTTTKSGKKGVKNVRVINIKGPNGKVIGDCRRPLKIGTLNYFFRNIKVINIMKKIPLDLDLIKYGNSKKTISKIEKKDHSLVNVISPREAFGIPTKFKRGHNFHKNPKEISNPVKVFASKGSRGYVNRKLIPKHKNWVDNYKFFLSRSNNIGTDMNDDNLNVIWGDPPSICTDSYIVCGAQLGDETSVINLSKYMNTKFARFLNTLNKVSIDASRGVYRYIPMQDFSSNKDIDWDKPLDDIDQQLFDKYRLTRDERTLIYNSIKDNTHDKK